MQRRTFLHTLLAGAGGAALGGRLAHAALPKMKITRVRYYSPGTQARVEGQNLLSSNVICIDTDAGITGIGEGGSKDTLEQCAGNLIGQNPFQSERLWQEMWISWFYPPGREKIHAVGALDLALWDIKGKAVKLPVHQMLGGSVRNYVECYSTGNVRLPGEAAPAPGGRGGRGIKAGRVTKGGRGGKGTKVAKGGRDSMEPKVTRGT